jgi:hypothetical protein
MKTRDAQGVQEADYTAPAKLFTHRNLKKL